MEQLSNFHQDKEGEAEYLKTLLSCVIQKMSSSSGVIEKIQTIAQARFCLQRTAKYLKNCYTDQTKLNCNTYVDIFEMTSILCDLPISHIR